MTSWAARPVVRHFRVSRGRLLAVVGGWLWFLAVLVVPRAIPSHAPGSAVVWSALALAAQAVLWPLLSWRRDARGWRRAVTVGFALANVATTSLGVHDTVLVTLAVAIPNVVAVLGPRWCVLHVAICAASLAPALASAPNRTWTDVVVQSASNALLFAAVAAVTMTFLTARWGRAEEHRVRTELEAAQAELRAYADQVHDLTIAAERARMAREMHDSLGHHLTVIKLGLENAERFRTRRPDDAWREVSQAKALSAQALDETRRWVRAMRPLDLDRGLGTEALRALAASFAGTGVDVRFAVDGTVRPLDPGAELVLYRALQEGLTNALRHAAATSVVAGLRYEPERVQLRIADNGRGGPPAPEAGFGLSALRERSRSIGGSVSTEARPGGGFVLQVELPVVPA